MHQTQENPLRGFVTTLSNNRRLRLTWTPWWRGIMLVGVDFVRAGRGRRVRRDILWFMVGFTRHVTALANRGGGKEVNGAERWTWKRGHRKHTGWRRSVCAHLIRLTMAIWILVRNTVEAELSRVLRISLNESYFLASGHEPLSSLWSALRSIVFCSRRRTTAEKGEREDWIRTLWYASGGRPLLMRRRACI